MTVNSDHLSESTKSLDNAAAEDGVQFVRTISREAEVDGGDGDRQFSFRQADGKVVGRIRFENQHLQPDLDKPSTRELLLLPFTAVTFVHSLVILGILRVTHAGLLRSKNDLTTELRERALLVSHVLDWFEIFFDLSALALAAVAFFALPSQYGGIGWIGITWMSQRIKVKIDEKQAYVARLVNRANNASLGQRNVRILRSLPEKSQAWLYPLRITLALQNKSHERRASTRSLEADLQRSGR